VLPSSKEPIKIHPASWMLLAPLSPRKLWLRFSSVRNLQLALRCSITLTVFGR
jgi:hypothetical protein